MSNKDSTKIVVEMTDYAVVVTIAIIGSYFITTGFTWVIRMLFLQFGIDIFMGENIWAVGALVWVSMFMFLGVFNLFTKK